ncbi:MAG: cyclic-di-AMP receptor [Clostridia bacterium]|nr:cyclic-di-AMP receptor [Clostridia bacterium]MBP5781641.1 cyclic-di-AMP receptor [Clostridia bacterium]
MKLIIAVVHDDDAAALTQALNRQGYGVTKMCSSGGFLRSGNTTLLCGVEEDKLEGALELIKSKSSGRKQFVDPAVLSPTAGVQGGAPSFPIEVSVGGATVFVIDVDKFYKF